MACICIQNDILDDNTNEIECLPSNIPDAIDVDVTNLNLGDALKVSDIEIDNNLEIKTASEQTIASVTHAMKEEDLTPVGEEEEEFMEEGEEGTETSEASSEGDSSSDDSKDNDEKSEG